jgi:hypothetical protein
MDLGLTEEEADQILNKDEFLSNTSTDFDPLKKKENGSMIELEEMSRNLLNSDLDSEHNMHSMNNSNQISDKELDHLLSSGFKSLDVGSEFKVSETINKSLGDPQKMVGGLGEFSNVSEFTSSKTNKNKNSEIGESGGIKLSTNIRDTIERAISIESSIVKGNTSDLNVHMSEIGEFDTGNFFNASDTVITSQDALDEKEDNPKDTDTIPEIESEEDSDEGFGDFIDRRSKIDLNKSTSKGEQKTPSEQSKAKDAEPKSDKQA